MPVKYYPEMIQGSDEWKAARCGLLTASEMKRIITPAKLQYASNDKERAHLYELMAQRITKYVEPTYISEDMIRGKEDEIYALEEYKKKYVASPDAVKRVGFVTNDKWGFTLGFSPDALVYEDGQIEAKSRMQKFQVETILKGVPDQDFLIQIHSGQVISERKWTDFISYCGGMKMVVLKIHPDTVIQTAILEAAAMFEGKMKEGMKKYEETLALYPERFTDTVRRVEQEIIAEVEE